jgi:hypothetical protein
MEQQGIMQDAAIKAQMNLADADFIKKHKYKMLKHSYKWI